MTANFTFKEKGHSYELDGKKLTGVTTVLSVLAKPQLIPWAARMTADWIREHGVHGVEEVTIGETLYTISESGLQEAVKAHTKKKDDAADKGKTLHSEVEEYIKKCIRSYSGEKVRVAITSPGLSKFSDWATRNNIRFLSSETPVYSRSWFCAGTPDFTFEKDGKRFVGDLKTYKKIWDIVPCLQTAAYAKMATEMGQEPFDGTCIVNINKETNELTDQWRYALDEDIKGFESALYLYRLLNK